MDVRCRWQLINGDIVIFELEVPENKRGQGLGSWFIDQLKDVARLKWCNLVAFPVEKSTVGFWEKMGFVADRIIGPTVMTWKRR